MKNARIAPRASLASGAVRSGLLAAVLLVVGAHVWGAIPASQREALVAIYNATGGPTWAHSDHWLEPPGTEGTWYGVGLDPTGQTVTGLYLVGLGLNGTLPDVWGSLPDLQILRLYDNALEGSLPEGLGRCWALYILDLHGNRFTGGIPPQWGGMRSMGTMDLSHNQLGGPLNEVPLRSMPHPWSLDIRDNNYWGTIPSSLCERGATFGIAAGGNALHVEDPELRSMLTYQDWFWWQADQVNPPGAPAVVPTGAGIVQVSWSSANNRNWSGGYRVYTSDQKGGPYRLLAEVGSSSLALQFQGFNPSATTYLQVRSWAQRPSTPGSFVESEPGPELAVRPVSSLSLIAHVDPTADVLPAAFSFSAEPSGGIPPVQVAWDFGDGAAGTGTTATHTYSKTGTHTFTATATDAVGNVATASGWATPYRPISVQAYAIPSAQGSTMFLWFPTVSGGAPPYSYHWVFGDGMTSDQPPYWQGLNHTYVSEGNYDWVLTVTDNAGHSASADGTVSVVLPLQLAATATPTSGAAPLAVHFEAAVMGGVPPVLTEWDFGDGSPHGMGLALDHTYTARWTYQWRMRAVDAEGTELRASGTINAGVPTITVVAAKRGPPFTLEATGTQFTSGCQILINGRPAPKTTYKNATLLVASGDSLLAMLPLGDTAYIQILDPALGLPSERFAFVRSSLRRPDPERPGRNDGGVGSAGSSGGAP